MASGEADAPTMEEMMADLQDRLAALQLEHEKLAEDVRAGRSVTVVSQPPPTLPRLKIFTGQSPTSPQETTFDEWHSSLLGVLEDDAITNKVSFIKRHLRGSVLHHANSLGLVTAPGLLRELCSLFGEQKATDAEFLEICTTKPKPGQKPSDHLVWLYGKLVEMQGPSQDGASPIEKKLYLAFSKSCPTELALELQRQFGKPGEGSPKFATLLKAVKGVEDLLPRAEAKRHQTTKASSQAVVTAENEGETSSGGETSSRREPAKRPKGTCYRCGLSGHFYRDCKNKHNPRLVAQRDLERRQRVNQWRKLKGMPELPLN